MRRAEELSAGPGSRTVPRSVEALSRSRLAPILSLARLTPGRLGGRLAFVAAVLAALLVGLICAVLALTWLDQPFAGFLLNPRGVVAAVGQYHWTGLGAGLQYPDKILTANGQPVTSGADLTPIVRGADVGTPVEYVVARGGQTIRVTVPTMRFGWIDLLTSFGLPFLSGLVYLLIGIIVFVLKPDTEVSWAFFLACLSLSVYTTTSFDIFSTHWGFIRLYILADAFFPAAFAHLSFVFPEKRAILERRPGLRFLPYAASAALVLPYQLLYPRPSFLAFAQLIQVYALVSAGAMLLAAIHAYFRGTAVISRQRAKVILAGAALAFPIPALGRYVFFAGKAASLLAVQTNFLAIPLLIFPASVAYAIAKHNLFDVDVYIKRAVGYGIMTAAVGLAYFTLQTFSTLVLGPFVGEYRETVYPLVFAFLVVFLFNPVNRTVQEWVDRIFFRTQFDYKRTISAVSGLLTSMLNLDQIVTQVIRTIRTEMFVDSAGLIVLSPKTESCRAFFLADEAAAGAHGAREVAVGYDDPLLALVREQRALVTRYDLEEDPRYADVKAPCLERFSALAATLAIPLLYHERVTGVLALGQKKSGHFFSREDVELLSTMANQAAVAIENATAHEEVVRYAEELAASLQRIQILESIKTNLAKFVPRTVQELIEESPEAPSLEKREIDVSVLFADITGYTRLSAQLEMSQVNSLVERYFGAFLDEIMSRGGDVNETAGDGLMVIFRKKDQRRHARAAVKVALGIQRRTRELNAELAGQFEPIEMKVGVNSGIASVGATRIEGAAGTRWTYTASGPTTNVAARLAALAEGGAGGGVVISEETRRRLDDEFQLEDLGSHTLKNVPQPVRAFRVTGDRPAGSPT